MKNKKISFLNPEESILTDSIYNHLERKVSKGQVKKWIEQGSVFVEKKRVTKVKRVVFSGSKVEVTLSPMDQNLDLQDTTWILFEDEDHLIVHKPPGVSVQPTKTQSLHTLENFWRKKTKNENLLAMHRLDLQTSGVLVFLKNKKWTKDWSAFFQNHELKKTYILIAEIEPSSLFRTGQETAWCENEIEGKNAKTQFLALSTYQNLGVFQALPETGRKHQIRIHGNQLGLRILGDQRYGSKRNSANRMMLHAHSLTFKHPLHKKELRVISPLPKDFQECLEKESLSSDSLRNLVSCAKPSGDTKNSFS